MTAQPWRRVLVEPARPDRVRTAARAHWWAVATVCVGAFMGQLDASIVTVALPSMQRELGAGVGELEWVSLSYLVVLIGLVAAAGRLSDVLGRKLLYTYGFVVFTLASLGCGLASSLGVLIAMRVVQAVGAAMLQANSVALIRTSVGTRSLHRAIGVQGAAQALGLALGPAVGGLLVDVAGWRWVFLVNLPAGVLGVVAAVLLLPRTRVRAARHRFDLAGLALLLPTATALLLACSALARGASATEVAVLGGLGLAGLAAFAAVERRQAAPLVHLELFAERAFRSGLASAALGYLVLFGVLFVTPLFLEATWQMSAGRAGLLLMVVPAALALAAPVSARLTRRAGAAAVTTGGLVLSAVGLLALVPAVHHRYAVAALLALVGLGMGLFTPANNASVAAAGRPEQAGLVSGLLNMTRGLGTALGVAVAAAAWALAAGHGSAVSATASTHGFRVTVLALGVLALVAAAVALGRGPGRPARRRG